MNEKINRREFIASTAAVAVSAAVPVPAIAAVVPEPDGDWWYVNRELSALANDW